MVIHQHATQRRIPISVNAILKVIPREILVKNARHCTTISPLR